MRFFKKIALVSLLAAGSIVGIAACKSTAKVPVTFVAVGSNTYDTEVQFGNFDYKFKGRVDQKSNSFTFEGKVQQRHAGGSGGGQGGWGQGGWGPGGGGQGGGGDTIDYDTDPSVPVTDLLLDQTELELEAGKSAKVNATVTPAYADDLTVIWVSSDRSVATVDNGQITAVNEGDAVITATTKIKNNISKTVNVHVYKTAVESIELDKSELNIEAGKSDFISATVLPANASVKSLSWSSNNPQVATVSEERGSYKVSAVGVGSAVLTAKSTTDPDVTAQVSVSVWKTAVTEVTLDKSSVALFINESTRVNASIGPENASIKDINWKSSDEAIAKVSNGEITGVGEGTAIITAEAKDDPSRKAEVEVKVSVESAAELAKHDWKITGTYTVDGYGYVLTLDDPNTEEGKKGEKTVIHVDYDKTQGRHDFYYNLTIEGQTQLVHFQAKDAQFKKSLVSGYKKWDERDAAYVFRAKATGNNNSLATAYLYLHKDGVENATEGTAVLNTPSGTERNITIGLSWKFENDKFIVRNGADVYESRKSLNPDKPGYMIAFGGYTFLISMNENVKWKQLTTGDFLGTVKHTFTGSITLNAGFPDAQTLIVTLYCTTAGGAYVYAGDKEYASGTFVEEGGEIKISTKYTYNNQTVDYEAVSTGNMSKITVKFGMSQQRGPNLSWSEVTVELDNVIQ